MRVHLPKSDGVASVSQSASTATIEALDEMMVAARKMIEKPQVKYCGDTTCHHSRRKHIKKHFSSTRKGKFNGYNYGACHAEGCRCLNYRKGDSNAK